MIFNILERVSMWLSWRRGKCWDREIKEEEEDGESVGRKAKVVVILWSKVSRGLELVFLAKGYEYSSNNTSLDIYIFPSVDKH